MTVSIRRISMLAMCLVVLTTTVGFACLVFAASAIGMPAGHDMPGCGAPVQQASVCPHADGGVDAGAVNPDSPPQSAMPLLQSYIAAGTSLGNSIIGDSGFTPEAPQAHQTPLRI